MAKQMAAGKQSRKIRSQRATPWSVGLVVIFAAAAAFAIFKRPELIGSKAALRQVSEGPAPAVASAADIPASGAAALSQKPVFGPTVPNTAPAPDLLPKIYYQQLTAQGGVARNPQGPDSAWDPAEPGHDKKVQRGGSFLCTDQYCSRYMVGARGKRDIDTGTNHLGFRGVMTAEEWLASRSKGKDKAPH